MKSTLRFISLFCILVTIPLTLTWATWEGNAGTGAASDFPGNGLYARSDMFPRNTVVQIVNLESGSSVRAVITGSSGVPGLVAVLSPETAAALNISEGAVVRVRITTPARVSETPAPGTLETGDALTVADPDVNPEAMVPLAAIAGAGEAPMIPVPGTDEHETFDDARESLGLTNETGEMSESPLEELPADTAVVPNEDTLGAEDAVAEDNFAEAPGAVMSEAAVIAAEDADSGMPADEMDATTAFEEADAATALEEAPVPETAESDLFYDEPELLQAEAQPVETVEDITLEPAELRPPESTMDAFPVAPPVVPEEIPETALDETVPLVEPIEEVPAQGTPLFGALALLPETPVEAAPPVNTARDSFDGDYPWIDRLNTGAYYVQIAAYKDAVNVRTILNRFGKKYPVVVQKGASSDKPLVKVYVGPLKKDEYGAVLEYFRKNGFPDAFARNIP